MVVKGIDISSQSGKINLKELHENNIEFVMLRAGIQFLWVIMSRNIKVS